MLTFHGDPARRFEASIVATQGDGLKGLALLRLPLPTGLNPAALRLDEDDADYTGEPATVVGFPANAGLAWAVTRGSVIGQKGTEWVFSGTVNEGNSGGPLVVKGVVAGIVVSATPLEAFVVPPLIVRLFLRGSGLDLAHLDDSAARSAPAASAGPGVSTESGPTRWAAVTGARWITFSVSHIDYLPPITDQFGEPDFILSARTDNGRELFGHEIQTQRPVQAQAQPAAVLDGVNRSPCRSWSTTRVSSGSSYETISKPLAMSLPAFRRSNKLRFTIDPKLFETYRGLDPEKTAVNLRFQLEPFDPEGASGPDAVAASPTEVPAGQLLAGSVDFDARDATDHLRLVAGSDTVTAILWATRIRPASWKSWARAVRRRSARCGRTAATARVLCCRCCASARVRLRCA